jgi:hypothetical protein
LAMAHGVSSGGTGRRRRIQPLGTISHIGHSKPAPGGGAAPGGAGTPPGGAGMAAGRSGVAVAAEGRRVLLTAGKRDLAGHVGGQPDAVAVDEADLGAG